MTQPHQSSPASASTASGDHALHGSARAGAIASFLYRYRWLASVLTLGFVAATFALGAQRIAGFSADVASLADTSNGSGAVKPLFFDPSMDVWFGEQDAAVTTYYGIEDAFVAEDFVMVVFDAQPGPLGVFSPESLATIARLSENFLKVPGVRHVRSLTYNPWIRWGTIEDELGSEEGLIISDLVEGDPAALSEDEIIERMLATLGAEKTAERVGEERLRSIIGPAANLDDYIGEPRLIGTILDHDATTTAIQIQVLRPRIELDEAEQAFGDSTARRVGPNLSSIEQQRSVLRGIEHFLRIEQGLCIPTEERGQLVAWIEGLPAGDERARLALELENPNKNFMAGPDGTLLRKFYEYDRTLEGYVDRTEPADPFAAPATFEPAPLSPFRYHLGGLPLFERNFEVVGLEDGKYVPMMFLVIIGVLLVVFRRFVGIAAPLAVVFGSIMGMIGLAFASGGLLNNLTMMSPNMLTAVGIADAIHIVAAWVLLRSRYDDKRELIVQVMRRNALPVLLTSLTTAVGFYSLTVSKLTPVQELGTMAAIGTFFAWLLSMTVVPALLSLVPHRVKAEVRKPTRVERMFSAEHMQAFVGGVIRRRVPILGVTAVLVAVGVIGLLRVEIDSDFRGMFPDDNPTMSDFAWIEGRMGGVGDLEIVFTGLRDDSATALSDEEEALLAELELKVAGRGVAPDEFAELTAAEQTRLEQLQKQAAAWNRARIGVEPEFLRSLEAFEARLRQEMEQPGSQLAVITDLVSPLDTLRKIHQVQYENRASYYRVPGSGDVPEAAQAAQLQYDEWTETWNLTPGQDASTLVAQYYLQYESGARPGEALWTQLSADRTQFRMEGRVLQDSSMTHLRAFQRIEEIARTEFPQLVAQVREAEPNTVAASESAPALSDFTLSGKTLLFARTSDLFSRGFVQSMTIALVVITLLIGILFRSIRFAAVSLVPNVLPIVLPLSVFGLLGKPLDGPAILVSTVALGVCVDDTIHFLTKFTRGRQAGLTAKASLEHALTEAGAALTVTTVVLMIGFSTLLLSDFAPNFQMGALAVLMIALAWVADFVVTAALLSFDGAREQKQSLEAADSPA